jgi:ABC-type antimicrobial peptide transport system permease subunit
MPSVLAQLVDESYFKTLLVPLRVGRPFETHDAQFDWQGTNQQVAIVNQKMVAEFWGNENVVGKVLVLESQPNAAVELQIVGVCGNVRQSALDQDAGPEVYLVGREHGVLVIRAGAPLAAMASQIRDVLHQIDPYMAVGEFTPLTRVLNKALAPKLVITSCLGSFSLVALGLAAIGIFGVTAYSTSQRTKEIGIRMALGATPGAVVRLIVRRGCSQVWTGCMIGLVAALACAHAVRSFLFEVSPVDPFTLASSCVLVILTGFVAGWLPARKASGMNPLIAIRKD